MRVSGPSARIGWARWATSAVRDRSSSTGYANRSIFWLGHARGRCDLVHGRSGADAGLDLSWAQLALQLDRDLAEPGEVPPGGGAQLLVGGHGEPLLAGGILEHDGELPAALGDPDDPQRPHPRPPALFTLPVRVTVDAQPQRCRGGAPDPNVQVRRAAIRGRARSVPG